MQFGCHTNAPLRYLGSLFYETEDVQVREEFRGYKNQSNDSHRNLCILAPDRLTWDGLLPLLSRWAFSQRTNSPDDIKNDERPHNCNDHHRYADRVPVKTAGGHLGSRGHGSQCSEPYQDTNSADRHRNGTGTLQDDEHKTRKTDKPTVAIGSIH